MFKKIALELGGKNPNLVFADADLDEAVTTGVQAAFANQGQICLCGSRIFVERPLYERFVDALSARAQKLVIGDPADARTEMGALINAEHQRKVEGYIELAREEGGEIVIGGNRPAGLPEHLAGGFFLEPTIIAGLQPGCRTMQEEIFGPVLPIMEFDRLDEALAVLSERPTPLALYLFTLDRATQERVLAETRSGGVCLNDTVLHMVGKGLPFGGLGESGVGAYHGKASFDCFSHPRAVLRRSFAFDSRLRYPPPRISLAALKRAYRFLLGG